MKATTDFSDLLVARHDLNPCPKCGGIVALADLPHFGLVIWCEKCSESFGIDASTEDKIISWWNDTTPVK